MKTNRLLLLVYGLLFTLFSQAQTDTINLGVYPNVGPVSWLNGSLCSGPDDNIWIGTGIYKINNTSVQGSGALRFNMISWTLYNKANGTLPSDNVYVIHKDPAGRMLLGTDKGLAIYHKNAWTYINRSNSRLKCDTILSIASRGNELYLGTARGLLKMHGSTFTHYDSLNWGVGSNEVTAAYIAKDGAVWIGVGRAIARFKNASWTTYHNNNSVYDGTYPLDIKEDLLNRIWISARGRGPFIIENGAMVLAYKRFCSFNRMGEGSGSLMAVDDEGSIYIGKVTGGSGIDLPVMMKIQGETLTPFYYNGGVWSNLHFNKGYIWKIGSTNFPLERFNHRAYKDWLPQKYPGYELSDTAIGFLNINKVNAVMQNKGDMFHKLFDRSIYEDKDFPCKTMFFKTALWMSGKDQDSNLYVAAMTYRQRGSDFISGPLDTVSKAVGTYRDFNRIWKLDRSTIETFKLKFASGDVSSGAYKIPRDILSWPAQGPGSFSRNLAPFADVNSDGIYNPYDGDYPKIKGDQMLYWIFNDNVLHSETGGEKFLAEIHASAYAFNCDTIDENSDRSALNRTTFYEYRMVNRSQRTYSGMKLGVWADFDIGNYADDHVGCNPRLNTMFASNADSLDDGPLGFGTTPPIANITMLSDTMNSFMVFTNGAPYPVQDPNNALEFSYFLNGKFQNGQPMTYGGNGMSGGSFTRFAFSGNDDPEFPGHNWTEALAGQKPGDRRTVMSTDTFTWRPGQSRIFAYAIMHTPNTFISTDEERNEARIEMIRHYYKTNSFPVCFNSETNSIFKPKPIKESLRVYPNPGSSYINFEIDFAASTEYKLSLYNMFGQELSVLASGNASGSQTFQANLGHLPAGIYVYTLRKGNELISGKLVIQR